MSTLEQLKRNKRLAPKKERLTVLITKEQLEALVTLHHNRPSYSAGAVVGDALRFALNNGMYQFVADFDDPTGRKNNIQATGNAIKKAVDKANWCTLYGGQEKDGMCVYDKYENTPSGMIVKNKQSQPLKSMPDSQEEFRRVILGSFQTISQAEQAFTDQTDMGAPEERIMKRKVVPEVSE